MALPLISGLNLLARQALPVIQRGVGEGLSSRAISSIIKDAFGKSIRRSTLLDVIRGIKGIEKANVQLKFIRKDRLPNVDRIPEAITRIRRNFSYKVKVEGHFIDTDIAHTEYINISSDINLTIAQIEAKALEAMEAGIKRYKLIVEKLTLDEAVKAGKLGTLQAPIRAV